MTIKYNVDIRRLRSDIVSGSADTCLIGISDISESISNEPIRRIKSSLSSSDSLDESAKSTIILEAMIAAKKASINSPSSGIPLPPDLNLSQIEESLKPSSLFRNRSGADSKRALIEYCDQFLDKATIALGQIDRASIACAKAILQNTNPKNLKSEATIAFNTEISDFQKHHSVQCTTDRVRDGITFKKPDGSTILIKDRDLTIETVEAQTGVLISGEQLGFILTNWHQGLFAGNPASMILNAQMKKSGIDPTESPVKTKNEPFCEVDLSVEGRVVIRNASKSSITEIDLIEGTMEVYDAAKFSIEADISSLKKNSFTPGLASGSVSPKLEIEVMTDKLSSLDLSSSVTISPESTQEFLKKRINERASSGQYLSPSELEELSSATAASSMTSETYLNDSNLAKFVAISDVNNQYKENPEITIAKVNEIVSSHVSIADQDELRAFSAGILEAESLARTSRIESETPKSSRVSEKIDTQMQSLVNFVRSQSEGKSSIDSRFSIGRKSINSKNQGI